MIKSLMVSTKFVKQYALKVIPVLTRLINKCLDEKHFPHVLKVGEVTPIHKNGDKTIAKNYRPIQKPGIFVKIFEKVLYLKINNFLEHNNIISKKQFGFIEKSNTLSACMEFSHYIATALDDRSYVGCIFIDLTKAFDTVRYDILLMKLQEIGVNNDGIKLFKSYLSNRKQAVSINRVSSELMVNDTTYL